MVERINESGTVCPHEEGEYTNKRSDFNRKIILSESKIPTTTKSYWRKRDKAPEKTTSMKVRIESKRESPLTESKPEARIWRPETSRESLSWKSNKTAEYLHTNKYKS